MYFIPWNCPFCPTLQAKPDKNPIKKIQGVITGLTTKKTTKENRNAPIVIPSVC
ncbi:hypothetical protein CUZ94_1875 [Enterococcus faecium]|nr:hypothetical protein [Enterococcus faecium]MBK4878325.1 hypothetical protein [Enterococcus faecium]